MDFLILDYSISLSWRLCRLLNEVGYSPKDRERKVNAAYNIEVFTNVAHDFAKCGIHEIWYAQQGRDINYRDKSDIEIFSNLAHELVRFGLSQYMFGSRSEGSTGPGLHSDRDLLFQFDGFKIVEDLTDCDLDKLNFLMFKDSYTHPGYVKFLKVDMFNRSLISQIISYGTDLSGRLVLSNTCFDSLLMFASHFGLLPYCKKAGPAIHCPSANKIYSFDSVIALRFLGLSREGCEWILRRRPFGWPTLQQIQNSRNYGCFATPIGHPCSFEQELEWRLSFSITERALVRSFEDTAMKVYILLKMIKNTFIQPVLGDAFSSYHCKVTMLWMRERTPQQLWHTTNLLFCLHLCLRQLREWASLGFCPDYFIVSNNIFDRKIFGQTRAKLQRILEDLLSQNGGYLLGIKCCNLGELLANRISCMTVNKDILLEVDCDYRLIASYEHYCRCLFLNFSMPNYSYLFKYLFRLWHAMTHAPHCSIVPLKHILTLLFAQIGFYLAVVYAEYAHHMSKNEQMNILNLVTMCLSNGIHSDASSVRLKLCGLAMVVGNCVSAEVYLQDISECQSRCTYVMSLEDQYITGVEINTRQLLEERYTTEELLQYRMSCSVVYKRSEISITPLPLRMEMFRSVGAPPGFRVLVKSFWYDWAVVDAGFYLHFLQYLTFCRQGKLSHKQVAIGNMMHLTRTKPGISHRETGLNLLGYCLIQDGKFRDAYSYFQESLKVRLYHNSAKFYLGILFRKVFTAVRS